MILQLENLPDGGLCCALGGRSSGSIAALSAEAVGPLKMAGDVVTDPAVLDRGIIQLGDRPGFGVEIDRQALARMRRA
jgi:L-alanine-DL-glutamate epimerase-like enolase superfamily enzyme